MKTIDRDTGKPPVLCTHDSMTFTSESVGPSVIPEGVDEEGREIQYVTVERGQGCTCDGGDDGE